MDVGGALRRADYIGPIGTATDALEFTYTVQAGDFDADGVALCASGLGCGSLQLNGGSIRGAADELEADLRLPALAAQSGHKVDAAEPLPVQPTVCADETRVPDDWPLKPSSITVGGKFRLMFLSSTTRNATSANIADYNSFVQGRAAAGHTANPALQHRLPGAGEHGLVRRPGQHLHHRPGGGDPLAERQQGRRQQRRPLRRGMGRRGKPEDRRRRVSFPAQVLER